MLTRAAQHQHHLRLSRGWIERRGRICKAASKSSSRRSSSLSTTCLPIPRPASRPSSLQTSTASHVSSTAHAKSLTTLADLQPSSYAADFIPFQSPSQRQHELGQLWPHTVNDLVKTPELPNPLLHNPTIVGSSRGSGSGSSESKMSHLMASIYVGRFDRAASIVRHITTFYQPDAPEVQEAHLQYLTGRLEALVASPSRQSLFEIQKWFEVDVKASHIPPSSGMYAVMIKAAHLVLSGSHLDRTIRRYLNEARSAGSHVEHETLSSVLFTEAEWSHIVRLEPDAYESPDEVSQINDTRPLNQTEDELRHSLTPGRYTDSDAPSVDQVASLKAVEQKGAGLESLRKSIHALTESLPSHVGDENTIAKSPEVMLQERLETDVLDVAMQRWREDAEKTKEMRDKGRWTRGALGAHVYDWIQKMSAELEDDFVAAATHQSSSSQQPKDLDRHFAVSFLQQGSIPRLCAIAVTSFLSSFIGAAGRKHQEGVGRVFATRVIESTGREISAEIRRIMSEKQALSQLSEMPSEKRSKRLAQLKKYKSETLSNLMSPSRSRLRISRKILEDWPQDINLKVGAHMLALVLKNAKLPESLEGPKLLHNAKPEMQSIAQHTYTMRDGLTFGCLIPSPTFLSILKSEPMVDHLVKALPMVCPPRPWTSMDEGGYLKTPVKALRLDRSSNVQTAYVELAESRGDLASIFAGLDVIGKVPWRINGPVLKTLIEVWNTGQPLAKIAPETPELDLPPEPSTDDVQAHRRWRYMVRTRKNEIQGAHSQRCYQNIQFELAKSYRDKTFYCPHSIDFRGRAYPIPPYLNHMGSDSSRGLFMFANGKPLGQQGLRWLKIHLSNTFGFDKESLDEREAFAMDHLADIYDSVDHPLDGRRWWMQAGDPWQCLAACHELKAALESPVPSEYSSHLPIQQDGSCNGLQHYAALGGDEVGAQQVNLAPGDKPADIYTAVAKLVEKLISKDAETGNKAALVLRGKITRKVVKQPVMTNVYGVTFIGAAAQVRKQLVDILPRASVEVDLNLSQLSLYVAGKIFEALRNMFGGAHAIQEWFGKCGAMITSSVTPEQMSRLRKAREGKVVWPELNRLRGPLRQNDLAQLSIQDTQFQSAIVWTTPLGLPVVQPYRVSKPLVIRTKVQRVNAIQAKLTDPVDKARQLSGFAPNFVHSLDATHMMLSAIKCDEIGMTFASVHDSFWTHACDIPVMNRVLRDAFIRIHSENAIDRLREEFIARYKGCMTWTKIMTSSKAGQKIAKHRKSRGINAAPFKIATVKSDHVVTELLEEETRQKLLQSEDPEEQAKGAAMITPASILEAELAKDPRAGGVKSVETHLEEEAASQAKELSSSSSFPADIDTEIEGTETEDPNEALLQTEDPGDFETEDAAAKLNQSQGGGDEMKKDDKKTKKNNIKVKSSLYLWRPIRFPEAPVRGTFDVSQLKDSQYFFS